LQTYSAGFVIQIILGNSCRLAYENINLHLFQSFPFDIKYASQHPAEKANNTVLIKPKNLSE